MYVNKKKNERNRERLILKTENYILFFLDHFELIANLDRERERGMVNPSEIRNKEVRSLMYQKLKKEKDKVNKQHKKKERKN